MPLTDDRPRVTVRAAAPQVEPLAVDRLRFRIEQLLDAAEVVGVELRVGPYWGFISRSRRELFWSAVLDDAGVEWLLRGPVQAHAVSRDDRRVLSRLQRECTDPIDWDWLLARARRLADFMQRMSDTPGQTSSSQASEPYLF
ncbi:MAG TPA: hypothetical protein VGE57_00335 [Solimonas sp.]